MNKRIDKYRYREICRYRWIDSIYCQMHKDNQILHITLCKQILTDILINVNCGQMERIDNVFCTFFHLAQKMELPQKWHGLHFLFRPKPFGRLKSSYSPFNYSYVHILFKVLNHFICEHDDKHIGEFR